MKVGISEVILVEGKHALFLTDEDVEDFQSTASLVDKEMDRDEILGFLAANIHLYYDGKKWGFTDTEVRESICEELEKQ